MEHPRRSCDGGRCRRRRGAAAAAANIWQRRATRELFQAAGLLIRHKLCKERLLAATAVCSPPAAAARSNLVRHAVRAGSVRCRPALHAFKASQQGNGRARAGWRGTGQVHRRSHAQPSPPPPTAARATMPIPDRGALAQLQSDSQQGTCRNTRYPTFPKQTADGCPPMACSDRLGNRREK